MMKTKMTSEMILMQSMTATGLPYKSPEQLSGDISMKVRQEKEDTTELRARLTEKTLYEMPRATKEAVNGIVTRLIYEQLHDAAVPDDPELTLKPDIKRTIRERKTKERYHNGKYEENKFDGKGKKAWSCCQSKFEDSEGCCIKVIDKQRWTVTTYHEI